MKLLVVGSGGREHAIAKKLLESEQVEQVFVAPGNDGMVLDGIELVNIGISEHSALINFVKENDIAWTFVGPDDALAAGIVDGSGGREHAIAKKLLESEQVEQVFVAPGNDGMTLDGIKLVNIGISEHSALINFAKENDIAWTFVGPDDALAAGIVDDFEQAGLKAFGPSRLAAELEWSKDFAKQIMVKYGIPTAAFGTFSNFEEAKAYIEEQGAPIVVKADGLALGKGVVVAETVEQAVEAAREMLLDNKFGDSGACVVIEEFLAGEEFSLFALVNGDQFYILPTAQDHKRLHRRAGGTDCGQGGRLGTGQGGSRG